MFSPLKKLMKRSRSKQGAGLKDRKKTKGKSKGKSKTSPLDSATSVGSVAHDPAADAIAIVEEYWKCLNAHDFARIDSFVTEDVAFLFHDADQALNHEMTWGDMKEELGKVVLSLPDFYVNTRSVHSDVTRDGDVMVVVEGMVLGGTHTALPWAYGACEPIEASNKAVRDDPAKLKIFFAINQRISRVEVYPKGDMTGLPGLYTQLGGFPLV